MKIQQTKAVNPFVWHLQDWTSTGLSQVHRINTRQTFDLYVPTANLTVYQKGVYYSGIKIYNHLPTAIKDLSDDKNKFNLALKRYLLHNSFYSLEEYFNV